MYMLFYRTYNQYYFNYTVEFLLFKKKMFLFSSSFTICSVSLTFCGFFPLLSNNQPNHLLAFPLYSLCETAERTGKHQRRLGENCKSEVYHSESHARPRSSVVRPSLDLQTQNVSSRQLPIAFSSRNKATTTSTTSRFSIAIHFSIVQIYSTRTLTQLNSDF